MADTIDAGKSAQHGFAPPASLEEPVAGWPLPAWEPHSVAALVREQAARLGDKPAVRFRSAAGGAWQDLSWGALDRRRRSVAAGLHALGVSRGDRVLVVASNSVEMLLVELGLLSLGAISAPIYSDYPPELVLHCLRDSGARVAVCGSALHQKKLAGVAGGQVERLVVLDDHPLVGDSRALGLTALEELPGTRGPAAGHRAQEAVDAATSAVRAEDVAFLLYTSGTTGRPKGVPLSHKNVLSQQAAMALVWSVGPSDVLLAYLPWHHCFGSLFERLLALWSGALLVLDDSRGRDLDRLLANLAEVKPTLYLSVPRVYQALVARAQADAKARAAVLHEGLRFVFTAAAPLPEGCYRFFEDAGVPVQEGWGLTESSPCCTLTGPHAPRTSGVTGWPLPGTEVRLAPSEQAGPGAGEVQVRGPQVMEAYWNNPAATGAVFTPDGWLKTGDLGDWTPAGLRVRGRIDGVFKLLNGEKVPSGEVEARLLAATPLLEQAVVLGVGQTYATALCWLSVGAARRFVEQLGLWPEALLEGGAQSEGPAPLSWLVRVPELRRAITEALQAANTLAAVPSERVRRVALVDAPLQIESGELTPTLKAVRRVVQERHKALAAALTEDAPHPQVLELSREKDGFTLAG